MIADILIPVGAFGFLFLGFFVLPRLLDRDEPCDDCDDHGPGESSAY